MHSGASRRAFTSLSGGLAAGAGTCTSTRVFPDEIDALRSHVRMCSGATQTFLSRAYWDHVRGSERMKSVSTMGHAAFSTQEVDPGAQRLQGKSCVCPATWTLRERNRSNFPGPTVHSNVDGYARPAVGSGRIVNPTRGGPYDTTTATSLNPDQCVRFRRRLARGCSGRSVTTPRAVETHLHPSFVRRESARGRKRRARTRTSRQRLLRQRHQLRLGPGVRALQGLLGRDRQLHGHPPEA